MINKKGFTKVNPGGLIFPWNMFFNVLGAESIGAPLSLEKTCP